VKAHVVYGDKVTKFFAEASGFNHGWARIGRRSKNK
jgi:hypothetical protein